MTPEKFKEIVDNQQAALQVGPGELLVLGATDSGEQVAVLQGRREEDQLPQFIIVTAPNSNGRNKQFATEVIPVGSRDVYHPSFDNGSRGGWSIGLADKRRIVFPGERAKAEEGAQVRIGSAAIRPVVERPTRVRRRTRHSVS